MMLFGKTVAITGGASGIGRRTAELAAQMGADVIGIDRNPPAQAVGDSSGATCPRPRACRRWRRRCPTASTRC